MKEAGWDVSWDASKDQMDISRIDDRTGKRLVIFEATQDPVELDYLGRPNVVTNWTVSFSAIILAALQTAMNGKGEA